MRRTWIIVAVAAAVEVAAAPATYPDRFVWVFGWSLSKDGDVDAVLPVIETAARHGFNGAVLSMSLDTLCKKDAGYFRRLDAVKAACERDKLEPIPAVFSVGYGGGVLAHDRNLAEGLHVSGAPFLVQGEAARLVKEPVPFQNGGFEEYSGHRMRAYRFHDKPGELSFADTSVVHGGRASLRFENFPAHQPCNARAMQEIAVQPRRCYRATVWVKTEGLKPAGNFRLLALKGERDLAPRTFTLEPTGDWRSVSMIFNSMEHTSVSLYAGVWNARGGKFWLDDWSVEEVGPINVLRRPGTPVTVTSDDGATAYEEGRDHAPLVDPSFNFYSVDREAPPLRILPAGRIRDGQKLRVGWYHPMVIHESQITVCMGEPKVYEVFAEEAALLAQRMGPKRVFLNMDEVRMGGTCRACQGKDMARLLGECVRKQVESLRKANPSLEVSIWSDMFDPHHNAVPRYYLVDGDYTGSWEHIPKDLVMAVWGGEPREKSLRFFAERGFTTLIACYYDADTLDDVKGWAAAARGVPGVRGFMYTPWQRNYALLGDFGDLLFGN